MIDRDDHVVCVNSYSATAFGKAVDQIIGQPRLILFFDIDIIATITRIA